MLTIGVYIVEQIVRWNLAFLFLVFSVFAKAYYSAKLFTVLGRDHDVNIRAFCCDDRVGSPFYAPAFGYTRILGTDDAGGGGA